MDLKFRRQSHSADRFLWIVAVASMVEAALQALDARLDGSWIRAVVWLAGSALLGMIAVWVETVKRRLEA